jgi:diacylglycerol kinase family enzyme
VIEEFEKNNGDSRGMLGYFKQLIGELVNLEPNTFQIHTPSKKFTVEAHMIAIANATKYGTGAILNPIGRLGDGKFEICIVKPFPAIAIVPITIKFFNGNIKESEFFEVFSCKKVTISNPGKATLQIDGEIIGTPSKVTAEILPNAFQVMVPRKLK